MKKGKPVFLILLLLIFASCSEPTKKLNFSSFLSEPCMIVNYEQDNTIEGEYLMVKEFRKSDSSIQMEMPPDFAINNSVCKNWIIGWGSNLPLFDAGMENLRSIIKIDAGNGRIYLGDLKRGKGFPEEKQRIVFWNTKPSGFYNTHKKPIIDPAMWPEFSGKSISFGAIEYDSLLNKWIMLVNECDTSKIQIYAAMSDDLTSWEAANNGKPVLRVSDFEKCKWAGVDITGKIPQTPYVSDIIRQDHKWYVFLDGHNAAGKRQIGTAVSKTSLIGPYTICKKPVVCAGGKDRWNDTAVFYAKVKKYKDGFIMFYDGCNAKGYERIGVAMSKDLIHWVNSDKNPVLDQHTGWRSSLYCTEPAYIEIHGDSIFLMVAGVKEFKMGFWQHYVTKRLYMDKSGNVGDAQLGLYLSTDGGKTFVAHKNNPMFTNDYSNPYENEHLGANFGFIRSDTADYIIYQAKSSHAGPKYNVMLRVKKK